MKFNSHIYILIIIINLFVKVNIKWSVLRLFTNIMFLIWCIKQIYLFSTSFITTEMCYSIRTISKKYMFSPFLKWNPRHRVMLKQDKQNKKNTVLNTWSEEIKDNFELVFNTTNKVKDVTCKVCRRHCHRIETLYRGKIVQDIKTYGQNGTSYIFKPNLERHMSSVGHIKCLEIETGEPVCKNQKNAVICFWKR